MKKSPPPSRRSLENEVIFAVVVLYLLLAFVMIGVHYMQPSKQETATSSTSPSHSEQKPGKSDTK
jgi:preprotein translocase subunit SecG